MNPPLAVIDLGTNTFQLIVARAGKTSFDVLFRKSVPSKLGKGGINRQIIAEENLGRAVTILDQFKEDIAQFDLRPEHISVFGTSAVRNAANKEELLREIELRLGVRAQIISGDREAELIYRGVREALPLGSTPHLIMDIGGGSIECIIADESTIFWKQSFEAGGQRLMDQFITSDPMSGASRRRIFNFLDQSFIPLSNAMHQYAPGTLVGSSGTFESLVEIRHWYEFNDWPPQTQNGFELPIEEFHRSRVEILSSSREERMKIPGLKELRVDMIPVGVCIIDYMLERYAIHSIRVSRYSLKEGALAELWEQNL